MLHYKVYNGGKKEWIVFVHGISGDMSTWDNHIDIFRQRYNLLLLDLPWHGKSKINQKLNRQTLNKEIKNVLDDAGVKKAHFIGLSLGSIVIAQFILRYPRYVSKAVFAASAIKVSTLCELVIGIANPIRYLLPYKLIYTIAISMVVPKDKTNLSQKIFSDGFKKMGRKNIIEWVSYLKIVLRSKETVRKLKQLNKTFFFISGEHDSLFLEGAKECARELCDNNIEIMDNCTHVCIADNAELFNDRVLNFLENVPA